MPGANILIMSPNYSLSQISFDLQRQLIRNFDLEVTRDNAKERIIELANGSTIRMGSVNQVDSVVGRSYDFIIFDECAISPNGQEAFDIALRPTLDKDNSKALFISTPRGRNNWFSDFYQRGYDEAFPWWASIHATYKDNPRSSEADIEEARRSSSAAYFAQEYEADFTMFEGQVWNFNNEDCIQDLSEFDFHGLDMIAGLDVGFSDPTAMCILGVDMDRGYRYVFDEYQKAEKSTAAHARIIQQYIDRYGLDFIFIDSAAAQTKWDLAQDHGISTVNAIKSVNDGLAAVGALVDNDMLIVDQRCKHTIASLQQLQWDPNPNLINEKTLRNEYIHMADALRYGVYSYQTGGYTF